MSLRPAAAIRSHPARPRALAVRPLALTALALSLLAPPAIAQPAPRADASAAPAAPATPAAPAAPAAPAVDRAAFARRLAGVREGMTRAQVRTAMGGAPDDVLTRLDPELAPNTIVTELWCWGADRHGAFPALGSVGFTAQGRVFAVHGARGAPPAPGAFAERDLRAWFALLAELPGLEGYRYDPRPVVRAVNALHPLGASRALDVIAEYLRVVPSTWTRADAQGVFLVLRALFEPDAGTGAHPPMHVGAPSPTPPADARVFPAFPLVLVDDVPLLLVSGYMLAGEAEPPASHLAWYRAHGVMRRAQLAPRAPRALTVLADFEREPRAASVLGAGAARAAMRAMLMEQLLRLVHDVYRPPLVGADAHFAPGTDPSAAWSAMVAQFDRLSARWDPGRGAYAASGVAPAPARVRAPRVRYEYAQRGLLLEVLLERTSPEAVTCWVHLERHGPGPVVASGTVRLTASGAAGRALGTWPIRTGALGSYTVSAVALPAGQAVTVHVEHAGNAIDSPALTP